jgi:exodeoxyribonuclease V alpha subunit
VAPIHRCLGPLIMQRNLLYTVVSRAREVCVLVGQREEVPKVIARNQQQRRFTRLATMLGEPS